MLIKRGFLLMAGLLFLWQLLITFFHLPSYILPTPSQVIDSLIENKNILFSAAVITISETLIGLSCAIILGSSLAISMNLFRSIKFWLQPILLISQALPIFAIAPLLVVWFGYGISAKIVTIVLMLFFPITSSFFDGLRQTHQDWLELATMMQASKWQILKQIRIPAALPYFGSGLRVATAAAPMGAIISEWIGSNNGLGFLMLSANAHLQIDLMFAALLVIVLFSLLLYQLIDRALNYFIWWQLK